MDDVWNDVRFISPPVYTYKCVDKSLDVWKLHTSISDAISVLEKQQILHREAAIISRLVYTMGRKFRHDIGHSYVRRTNVALLKYLNLNYTNDLKNVLSVVPETFIENYIYVPTRQMIEYILIRTQTIGKIIFRINMCAKKAALFYFERLKRGDSAWLSIMPYSVLSRVWLLTKTFLKNVCKWYNNILPFIYRLNLVGAPILPCGYEFPNDLSSWINVKVLDAQSSHLWKSCDILSLISNSEAQQDITKQYETGVQEYVPSDTSTNIQRRAVKNVDEDIGEKISRNEYSKKLLQKNHKLHNTKETNRIKNKKIEKNAKEKENSTIISSEINVVSGTNTNLISGNSCSHSINSVKCLKSLKSFLKAEENLRLHKNKCALTKNIGIIQWQSVKKIICKKMLKLFKKTPTVSPDVFSKTFQCLWSEKCK